MSASLVYGGPQEGKYTRIADIAISAITLEDVLVKTLDLVIDLAAYYDGQYAKLLMRHHSWERFDSKEHVEYQGVQEDLSQATER